MEPMQHKPRIITRGHESPPLTPGPQRLHYQFSTALPLTQLTFASVLQGVVFCWLLYNIPLPPVTASFADVFDFIFKQHLYLPYIISSLIIIVIWNQFVHASLFVTWPLSIFQSTLLFLLTVAEMLTFGKINSPSLTPWLFGLGWVSIFGGIVRLHNVRWYHDKIRALFSIKTLREHTEM